MIRIGRIAVIGAVARVAVRRGRSSVAVCVTLSALNGCMCTGQGEAGSAVVKRCAGPIRRAVTLSAVVRKSQLCVVGTSGVGEVCSMARIAIGVQFRGRVRVAGLALH